MEDFAGRYRLFAFSLVVVVALAGALLFLRPFYPALLWATVLSVLVSPVYARLRKRWSPSMSALWATLFTLAVVGIPMLIVGFAIYAQASVTLREVALSGP